MPHITKYSEKIQCIRRPIDKIWKEDLERKYKRIPESVANAAHTAVRALAIPPHILERLQELPTQYSYMTPEDKCSIFDLVEEVISNTMKSNWTEENFLKDFVEIKEVPYGRYNSDSDYRGS